MKNQVQSGGFELNPKAWSVDGVPWAFTQQLLYPEWDLFDELMAGAMRRVPILEEAEVSKLVNGPDAITPEIWVQPIGYKALAYLPLELAEIGI